LLARPAPDLPSVHSPINFLKSTFSRSAVRGQISFVRRPSVVLIVAAADVSTVLRSFFCPRFFCQSFVGQTSAWSDDSPFDCAVHPLCSPCLCGSNVFRPSPDLLCELCGSAVRIGPQRSTRASRSASPSIFYPPSSIFHRYLLSPFTTSPFSAQPRLLSIDGAGIRRTKIATALLSWGRLIGFMRVAER
jgi:hypothetical protein